MSDARAEIDRLFRQALACQQRGDNNQAFELYRRVAEAPGHVDAWNNDLGPRLEDFAVTAAVLPELDLVVTVDPAVAHLAGAMGRQCFVLSPHAADRRWLRGRAESPWYPTLRLFRQEMPGDWAALMRRVRAAVAPLAQA